MAWMNSHEFRPQRGGDDRFRIGPFSPPLDAAPRPAPWRGPDDPTPLTMVFRHPLLFACVLAGCVAAAWGYVRVTTPLYTSSASLRVLPAPPPIMGVAEPARSIDEITAFLNAEMAVLTSGQVVASRWPAPTSSRRCARPRHWPRRSPKGPTRSRCLKKGLRAPSAGRTALLSVEYDAPSADGAAAVVNALVDAYAAHQSHQTEEMNRKLLTILTRERADCEARFHEASDQMLNVVKQGVAMSLDARDRAQELAGVRNNLRAAQFEATAADRQYHEAAGCARRRAGAGGPTGENDRRRCRAHLLRTGKALQVRMAITDLEMKKQDVANGRTDLPSHTQVLGVQRQLDTMRVLYAGSAHNRMVYAKDKVEKLTTAVCDQESAARDQADAAARYGRPTWSSSGWTATWGAGRADP